MTQKLPHKTRVYQNHTIDSERWKSFVRRPDDIIIATPYKCGTTWTQAITLQLVFQGQGVGSIQETSRWLDYAASPLQEVFDMYDTQTHRRVIKTHLPLDGFDYDPHSKFIVVSRDPRDVFMSLWNHYSNYTDAAYAEINERDNLVGDPQPRCPADIKQLWNMWIGQGWFEWESEGYPFWTNFHHVQSWFDYRHLPNIKFVHFNNLLADLEGQILEIADYLEIKCSAALAEEIAGKVTFAAMKKNAAKVVGDDGTTFQGGMQTFVNKGTNGRWRTVLTAEDLAAYDATANRTLTKDCRRWLETGQL